MNISLSHNRSFHHGRDGVCDPSCAPRGRHKRITDGACDYVIGLVSISLCHGISRIVPFPEKEATTYTPYPVADSRWGAIVCDWTASVILAIGWASLNSVPSLRA